MDEFIEENDDDGDVCTVVYIDGACSNNGRPNAAAGLGVWFNRNHKMLANIFKKKGRIIFFLNLKEYICTGKRACYE